MGVKNSNRLKNRTIAQADILRWGTLRIWTRTCWRQMKQITSAYLPARSCRKIEVTPAALQNPFVLPNLTLGKSSYRRSSIHLCLPSRPTKIYLTPAWCKSQSSRRRVQGVAPYRKASDLSILQVGVITILAVAAIWGPPLRETQRCRSIGLVGCRSSSTKVKTMQWNAQYSRTRPNWNELNKRWKITKRKQMKPNVNLSKKERRMLTS